MKSGAALIFSGMQQAHGDPAAQMTLREKLRHVSWSLVLLICLVASVGFAMLYSAAHGNLDPWADRQIARFAEEFMQLRQHLLVGSRDGHKLHDLFNLLG